MILICIFLLNLNSAYTTKDDVLPFTSSIVFAILTFQILVELSISCNN